MFCSRRFEGTKVKVPFKFSFCGLFKIFWWFVRIGLIGLLMKIIDPWFLVRLRVWSALAKIWLYSPDFTYLSLELVHGGWIQGKYIRIVCLHCVLDFEFNLKCLKHFKLSNVTAGAGHTSNHLARSQKKAWTGHTWLSLCGMANLNLHHMKIGSDCSS